MADPMPEHVVPMLARLAKLPSEDGGWAYEIKWDGVRAVAYVRGGDVRLESRNLNDISGRYPELAALPYGLAGREAVLDGEVVAFDDKGRSSFGLLQGRMHLTRGVEARARTVPVVYCIFDLLWLDGEDLRSLPYNGRRARLEGLGLEGSAWRTPAYSTGNGAELLEASAEQGLEGIVCKRLDSAYETGRRGRSWLKVKNTRRQELVIGGWQPGEGRRSGRLGALLVGYNEGGELRYAGKVGTGFDQDELDKLQGLLAGLRRDGSPFAGRPQPERGSIYVEPKLVAEIDFAEWTAQGMLRHPSYKGLRDDKRARDVVRERPGAPSPLDHYRRVAPWLLPHLRDRELTLRDAANRVSPGTADDVPQLLALVEAGAVELDAALAFRHDPERPTALVFELAADEGAALGDCRELALALRRLFDQLALESFPKANGAAGIQVYVPLGGEEADEEPAQFAKSVVETLARGYPERIGTGRGRVLAPWRQNLPGGAAPAPYSLLARAGRQLVSMPVGWEEVEAGPDEALAFDSDAALARLEERGDAFAPLLALRQDLPRFD